MMQSALAEPQTPLELPDPQSTVLSPSSWQICESLLKDLDDNVRIRLIYDREQLDTL